MDLESVSHELYGLPLEDFIPTRTERERQARSAGDTDLATRIHQLAKPNLVAWLANQLAREHADQIGPLLEVGAGLREATATLSGERLRELSRQQRRLISALVHQARGLAQVTGRKVSADTARRLESTLRAALADPETAEALATGRLSEGMQSSFGSLSGRDEHPARSAKNPSATAAASATAQQDAPKQRRRAEHDIEQVKSAADEAAAARKDTLAKLEAAARMVVGTSDRVERVRRELNQALEEQSSAERDRARAQEAFNRADRGLRDAQRRLTDATKHLQR